MQRTAQVNLLFYNDLFGHVRLVIWIGLETIIIKTGKMNLSTDNTIKFALKQKETSWKLGEGEGGISECINKIK